jgi:hypothetical protein
MKLFKIFTIILILSLGNSLLAQEANFDIYPNPASSKVTVSYNSNTDYQIIITNLIGTEVYRKKASHINLSHTIQLDALGLNTGMYLIKIQIKNQTVAQKRLIIKTF